MTLNELLGCLTVILFGIVGAGYGLKEYGAAGFLLGVPAGLLGAGLLLLWAWISDLLFRGSPYLPACRSGRCGRDDYELSRAPGGWKCRCGRVYDRRGPRFVEYDETGTPRPYLKWVPLRGWRVDR